MMAAENVVDLNKKDAPKNAPIFELSGVTATITSMNIDDESKGKQAKRRVDLDMTAVVDPEVLKQMAVVAEDAPDYQGMLFTTDGKQKATGQKKEEFDREFTEHVFTIHMPSSDKVFHTKKLRKFSYMPAPNSKVNLSFQVQVYPDTADELWELTKYKGAGIDISIERPPQKDVEE